MVEEWMVEYRNKPEVSERRDGRPSISFTWQINDRAGLGQEKV